MEYVLMRVSGTSFGSAYISGSVKGLLSPAQQDAILEVGNKYSNRHIIAGLAIGETPKTAKNILLRINDIFSSKELGKLFVPLYFSPEQIKNFPRYVFKA